MRRLAALLFATLATAAITPLGAQGTHPDFTGKWALDVTKLEGPMAQAGITSDTVTISQTDKAIQQIESVVAAQGAQADSTTLNLDGTETKHSMTQGEMTMDLTSSASWDGTTLVVVTKSEIQGNPFVKTDRYNLDPSGKAMTIDSSISVMGQNLSFKQTFNKA